MSADYYEMNTYHPHTNINSFEFAQDNGQSLSELNQQIYCMLRRTNKLVLAICALLICTGSIVAQNSSGKLIHSEKPTTTSENSTEPITKFNSGNSAILQKYLGLSSSEHPDYAQRKLTLKEESPLLYEAMLQELTAIKSVGKTVFSRAQFDALPFGLPDCLCSQCNSLQLSNLECIRNAEQCSVW
jgi:hypothetical protein